MLFLRNIGIRYNAIRSRVYGAFVRTGPGRIAGKFNLKNATAVTEQDYRWPRTARNFFIAQARFSADGRIPNILRITL
jgi:hypothetical protein